MIITCSFQDSKVAPGDVIQVKVVAHDQGGNTQAALWSVEHIQLLNVCDIHIHYNYISLLW